MSQKSSVPQAVSFVSQVLKRDRGATRAHPRFAGASRLCRRPCRKGPRMPAIVGRTNPNLVLLDIVDAGNGRLGSGAHCAAIKASVRRFSFWANAIDPHYMLDPSGSTTIP